MAYDMNNTTGREMKVSKKLKAPIELVWEVWTNPEHIQNWWGPNGFTNTIHKMEVAKGGEWLLTMHAPDGKSFRNKSIYREIVPFKKVVYEHFNPGYLATIIFEPTGKETFMEWTMLLETVEMYETLVKTFKADEGLKQNGEKLEKYLEEMTSTK